MDSYFSINDSVSAEIVEKKSRFISYIKHVETEEEANAFIAEIKSKHYDARHNVYAYILKNGKKKYSDDGEPQGTAGVPILDIIDKEELFDVCIVVTRYFGGILLGTGGLVRAYSDAAKLSIDNSKKVEHVLSSFCKITCTYNQNTKLPTLIYKYDGTVDDTKYEDDVVIMFHLPKTKFESFKNEAVNFFSGNINIEEIEEKFAKNKG